MFECSTLVPFTKIFLEGVFDQYHVDREENYHNLYAVSFPKLPKDFFSTCNMCIATYFYLS